MGVPLILPAAAAAGLSPTAIAAAAGLASTGINALSQGSLNRKTRQWNEAMYQKQREDALADWARTNEYNAPLQQMARLKEEVKQLVTNNQYNALNQAVKYKINGFLAEQTELINKGLMSKNKITDIEA